MSLPELLVSMALLGMVATLLYQLTWMGTRAVAGGEDRIELEHERREARRRLERGLSSVSAPTSGASGLLEPDLAGTSTELRFLSLMDLLETGVVLDPANPVFIEYVVSLRGDELWLDRADGVGNPERICRGVRSVNYRSVNQRAVVVDLVVEGQVRNARNQRETQSRRELFSVLLPPTE